MNKLSTLIVAIKEDVNNEKSIILHQFYQLLKNMFILILWFGIPFTIYLILQFTQLF